MARGKKSRAVPPRPTVANESVIQNGILEFCQTFRKYDATILLEVWSPEDDAYSLARALENYDVKPTEDTVTELSQLESYIYDSLANEEKRWVQENNIKLRILPGQQISFPIQGKEFSGVILKVDHELAIYIVSRDNDTDSSRFYRIYAENIKVLVSRCVSGLHKPWPCPSCGLGPCFNGDAG